MRVAELSPEQSRNTPIPVLCCCDPDNELGFAPTIPGIRLRPYVEIDESGQVLTRGAAYGSDDLGLTEGHDPEEWISGTETVIEAAPKKSGRKKARKKSSVSSNVKRNKKRWL